jgi:hypothetical protein
MGRGYVRPDRHRRHDHRAAGALLHESGPDAGRDSDHRRDPNPRGEPGEWRPLAVAIRVTDGIAFAVADADLVSAGFRSAGDPPK